jgi:hypothetical protein
MINKNTNIDFCLQYNELNSIPTEISLIIKPY